MMGLMVMRQAAAFVLLAVTCVSAQTRADLPPEVIEKVEAIVSEEMARQGMPALSVAIAVDNRVRYANGFGLSDLENQVPARATTVYRTASIAKAMTATAVMQLAEQEKIDLDAPIQRYCPTFPQKRWPVTARQLLGHLGGIRHYKSGEEATGKEHFFSVTDSMALFQAEELLHEPGTKYQYTTYGYSVLGCALEGASGMTYEEYMEERIFGPAGMHQTGVDNLHAIIPNRARGYVRLDEGTHSQLPEAAKRSVKVGEIYNAQLHDTSMKVPGGGLVSTAVDLVRFAIAMEKGALVKPETREAMWTVQKTRDGKETGYGLGWGVGQAAGMKLVMHGGGQAGTSTMVALLPGRDMAIALMSNLQGISLGQLTNRIGEVLMSAPPNRDER